MLISTLRPKSAEFVLLFGLVPLLVAALFLAPTELQESLILCPNCTVIDDGSGHGQPPTWQSIFFSHYLHYASESDGGKQVAATHLLANMLVYCLASGLLLWMLQNRRRPLLAAIVAILFVVPILASLATIKWDPTASSRGISGIDAALLGLLLIPCIQYARRGRQTRDKILGIILLLLVSFLIVIMFPTNPEYQTSSDSNIRISYVSHFIGLVFGVAASIVLWTYARFISRSANTTSRRSTTNRS